MNEQMPMDKVDDLSTINFEDINDALKNSFPELKQEDFNAASNRVALFLKNGASFEDALKKFSKEHEESKNLTKEVFDKINS